MFDWLFDTIADYILYIKKMLIKLAEVMRMCSEARILYRLPVYTVEAVETVELPGPITPAGINSSYDP